MSEPSRRRVSYGPLEHLWEFLIKHRNLAMGYKKTSQAREFSRRMWEEVAQNLNAHGDGAVKDWKGWCKYWNDYKCKLKKLAAANRSSKQKTGGGPSSTKTMTDLENKFLIIMGEDFGCGLSGVRVEPFEEETEMEVTPETSSRQSKKSVSLLTGISNQADNDFQPGPFWRVTPPPFVVPLRHDEDTPRHSTPCRSPRHTAQPPKPTTPPPLPLPPTSPHIDPTLLSISPRRSPRRRPILVPSRPPRTLSTPSLCPLIPITERQRRSRRELSISAEAARRSLIVESQRLNSIEEQKLEVMKSILGELRDIKIFLQK